MPTGVIFTVSQHYRLDSSLILVSVLDIVSGAHIGDNQSPLSRISSPCLLIHMAIFSEVFTLVVVISAFALACTLNISCRPPRVMHLWSWLYTFDIVVAHVGVAKPWPRGQ